MKKETITKVDLIKIHGEETVLSAESRLRERLPNGLFPPASWIDREIGRLPRLVAIEPEAKKIQP